MDAHARIKLPSLSHRAYAVHRERHPTDTKGLLGTHTYPLPGSHLLSRSRVVSHVLCVLVEETLLWNTLRPTWKHVKNKNRYHATCKNKHPRKQSNSGAGGGGDGGGDGGETSGEKKRRPSALR